MQLTRRDFNRLSVLAGAAAAWGVSTPVLAGLARRRQEAGEKEKAIFEWDGVKSGAAWAGINYGGNALVVASRGETLLVDCKNAGFGSALRRETEEEGRLVAVVNTHHHADHSGGNSAFVQDVGVTAHENAIPRVRAQVDRYKGAIRAAMQQMGGDAPASLKSDLESLAERLDSMGPDDFAPTVGVGAESSVTVGAHEAMLRHAGAGHTDNDVFVFLPSLNVLHTGDLVFHELHPFIDRPAGATTRGWQKSIDAMIALCNDETVVVPGHGSLTNVDGLRQQREYFDDIRAFVEDAITRGVSLEQIREMDPPEKMAHRGFRQIWPRAVGAVFEAVSEGA
ncbi:MAG: MBL fold metallo-hydrolase [Planctomycetota bacterium]|nr:MBL fold metallo-hydrolase [Planctomycetota bacterium]